MSGSIFINNQETLSEKAETLKVKKKRGRPPKERHAAEDERQLLFRAEAAAAFRKAKLEYEKTSPFELSNVQFMMLLITTFSENK